MRTVTKVFKVYNYNELSEEAKEKVRQLYINDPIRNDLFYYDIKESLKSMFPKSDLDVTYSLCYCQGDGLNIEGKLNYYDFLKEWVIGDKTRRTMQFYIDQLWDKYYTFHKNNHYSYSCKFIDMNYIDDTVDEFVDELKSDGVRGVKDDIIKLFLTDMLDCFEELDDKFKKEGYQFLYEPDEEEIEGVCEANGWEFLEDGTSY